MAEVFALKHCKLLIRCTVDRCSFFETSGWLFLRASLWRTCLSGAWFSGTMPLHNGPLVGLPGCCAPNPGELCLGKTRRAHMVDDGLWVMLTDLTASSELLHGGCFPRRMNTQLVKARAFGHPAAYELALGVLIHRLLDGVIDAQGINARRPRLHLHLWIVDTWLKIDKELGQMVGRSLPMQPKVVGSKGHQHGPHAEVDPTLGDQETHAGIDKRITRLSGAPGLEFGLSEIVLTQAVTASGHVAVF